MNDKFLPDSLLHKSPAALLPNSAYRSAGSGDYETETGLDIRNLGRILYKYRLLITGITLFSALLTFIYVSLVTPLYTATVTLRIGTYQPTLTTNNTDEYMVERSKETDYYETQLKEVTSFTLADRVLQDDVLREKLFPRKAAGFFSKLFDAKSESADNLPPEHGFKHPLSLLESYLKLVNVLPVRKTSLAILSATTSDPRLSAGLANSHAQAYIDWVRASRIEQQSMGLKFLKTQELELKDKILDLEREISEYAEAHSIVALNKDENITSQRMAQLNKLLTDSTEQRLEAENLYKEAENAMKAESPAAAFDDSSVETMRARLAELQSEYGNLSAKFMPGYPKMQQLQAQISNLKSSIRAQRNQIVLGLKAKAQAYKQKEDLLKEELEKQKSSTFELSRNQAQYDILNRELESSRELLQNILRQMKETGLAVQSNASNVAIVDPASIPNKRSYPRKTLSVFMGFILGLLSGIFVAAILNYFDNTLRTPEQAIDILGVPNLGVIPSFSEDTASAPRLMVSDRLKAASENNTSMLAPHAADEKLPVAYLNNPRSLVSEAYRTIRTAMLLSQAGEPPRRILVSSAQSSEGKTTSVVNLAATLASAGANVVIIDADLRRPNVWRFFNVDKNRDGLVEVITGQKSLHEVAISNVIKRITLIPSGEIPPNPAELLGSLEMATLIDELARNFDYVLIDSPPVLPVTDAVILSRYVDGVLIVVKGASTPRKVVRDALHRLKAVGARVLGTVLNDVDVTGGDYYYYNRYYSSYHQETEDKRSQRSERRSRVGGS